MVAVACFLPGRAKDLSAPPRRCCVQNYGNLKTIKCLPLINSHFVYQHCTNIHTHMQETEHMSSSDFQRRLPVTALRVQPTWKTDSYSAMTASSPLLSKPEIRYYVHLCQPTDPVLYGFMHKAMALVVCQKLCHKGK